MKLEHEKIMVYDVIGVSEKEFDRLKEEVEKQWEEIINAGIQKGETRFSKVTEKAMEILGIEMTHKNFILMYFFIKYIFK